MAKNWTQKLRHAVAEHNARVVVADGVYRDESVTYKPRFDYDRFPWLITRKVEEHLSENEERVFRFSGRDCRAIFPNDAKD
jgi:hypothetical protein